MMRRILFFAALFLAAALPAMDFYELTGENNEIFKADRPRFITSKNAPYFRWTSSEKTSARFAPETGSAMELFNLPLKEVIVKFQENSVSSVYFSFYNRGDSGEISQEDFNQILKDADAGLQKLTGISKPFSKKEKLADLDFVYVRIRKAEGFAYILQWSSGGTRKNFKPEYIQLEIEKLDPANDPCTRSYVKSDREKITAKTELVQNVAHEENGNVWIRNIPMVDQGQKGYCAAAVCERVLRYYGSPVTQHTIAQIAGTDSEGGTNLETLTEMLKKLGVKLGVKASEEYCFIKKKDTIGEFSKFLKQYNKFAKKAKKPQVELVQRGNMVYLDETTEKMDPDIFLEARSADPEMKSFLKKVHEYTDKGIPLLWGVELGKFPEEKMSLQSKGGHLRLIIGYNDKNREILYTDTWGIGHELKSMPQEYAWAMSQYLIVIEPRAKQ